MDSVRFRQTGYAKRIGFLQRSDLDEQHLAILDSELDGALRVAVDLSVPLPIWLAQVREVSRFWQVSSSGRTTARSRPSYLSKDILAGLSAQRIALYYLIRGRRNSVSIYVGTERAEDGATVRAVFESRYPGLRLWPGQEPDARSDPEQAETTQRQWRAMLEEMKGLRSFMARCEHIGVMTGMPNATLADVGAAGTQMDRLIRGLYDTEWALLVMGVPLEDSALVDMRVSLIEEGLELEREQGSQEWRAGMGQPIAYFYDKLLKKWSKAIDQLLAEGAWQVQSYICTPEEATYARAKGLVKSIFSGGTPRLERIRILDCPGAGLRVASFSPIVVDRPIPTEESRLSTMSRHLLKYHSLVSSAQLSALVHLPREEVTGYYVRESATFDVSAHVPSGAGAIEVGEILDRKRPTGNQYRVRTEDMTKHCLLVGITGGGKTTTAFHLLQEIRRQDPTVGFMVIEPTKREYRQMAPLLASGDEGLRVFTVGEEGENSAPFRLNPFEIRPRVAVQTHIDLLKSVFNASFGMWTPLPQVLERAIQELYRDKGWDPVHGTNDRAAMGEGDKVLWHAQAHPTLTDLYHKVIDLVPQLGYDKEVTRNVSTALQTRINGLRVGAKGMMLDTQLSIPIERLLTAPTILELEGVGDDDDKAFIMGLILIALYEYHRAQGTPTDSGLRHIMVIEEAHRLLTNVPPKTDPEASNLRGKAVETFANMLSEVRAYGEGFVIAEQIPTKLAPDVIKNTALKIMHRVVANDDREAMGGAMNLNRQQQRQVVSLGKGEAVVHGGGDYSDDNPMLIQVPRAKGAGVTKQPSASSIREAWVRFVTANELTPVFTPYPSCDELCAPLNPRCRYSFACRRSRCPGQACGLRLVSGALCDLRRPRSVGAD